MSIFGSFLFKLVLTVIISVFIGFQLAKIELKETQYSFRKILGDSTESQNLVDIDKNLQSQIESFLSGKEGDYAIYVKDLKPEGKRNVCIRCDEKFEAASLYKVFLMAAIYQAVNEGKFTLDSQISAKMSHLKDVYGGVDFGYEDFPDDEIIEYSVREALDRIARISDNFAALMLAEKVGWSNVQSAADEIEARDTSIKSPITTSAKDIGTLLEKLYNGQIVSLESSEQILDTLTLAQINNRIPAKLPDKDPSTGSGLRIAHKTGELAGVRNDAGIVFLAPPAGGPYAIVEMSMNLKGEDEGVETLAEISKIVYDYYNANSELRIQN